MLDSDPLPILVRRFAVLVTLATILAACGSGAPSATLSPTDPVPASPTSVENQQASQSTASISEPTAPAAAAGDSVHLVLAASGNEARYVVREQLASVSFPTDAIGKTSDISGALFVNSDGTFIADGSGITVNLASIRSDEDRRDNYVRQRVLETARYPTVVLVPTEARGLDVNALREGETTFELVGDMTVHGVTKQVVWNVTASLVGNSLTGTAYTEFTFEDFGMTVPSVMVVLSVEDKIRLEYDFNFMIEAS
jgi:polyisoprenoid-binding protein YceI